METTSREYDALLGKQIAYYRCSTLVWRAISALNLLDEKDPEKVKVEARRLLDDILHYIRDQRVAEEVKYEQKTTASAA